MVCIEHACRITYVCESATMRAVATITVATIIYLVSFYIYTYFIKSFELKEPPCGSAAVCIGHGSNNRTPANFSNNFNLQYIQFLYRESTKSTQCLNL